MVHTRFAVYFTPEPGPLAKAGADWLGWDIATGTAVPQREMAGLDAAAITQIPRKYGFHATLKPPFRLAAPARGPDDVLRCLKALCARLSPVTLAGLKLARLGQFLALLPAEPSARLDALAAALVTGLDALRARPDAAELARRRQAGLSVAQDKLLIRWGYPYVLEEFRFHMTLTGRLDPAQLDAVAEALRPAFTAHLDRPLTIREVTLAGERPDGCFEQIHRVPLSG